jgi:hypothetical protein
VTRQHSKALKVARRRAADERAYRGRRGVARRAQRRGKIQARRAERRANKLTQEEP